MTLNKDRKQIKYGHKRQEHMTHTTELWQLLYTSIHCRCQVKNLYLRISSFLFFCHISMLLVTLYVCQCSWKVTVLHIQSFCLTVTIYYKYLSRGVTLSILAKFAKYILEQIFWCAFENILVLLIFFIHSFSMAGLNHSRLMAGKVVEMPQKEQDEEDQAVLSPD